MLIWLLVNVLLTALALVFMRVNRSAPHRLRFHVGVLALLGWLVPWSLVPRWLPSLQAFDLGRAERQLMGQTNAAAQFPVILIDTHAVPLANNVTLLSLPLLILLTLFATGVVLFGWNLFRHHRRLLVLKRSAHTANNLWQQCGIATSVPVLLQDRISGAFSSGIVQPAVWVHTDLAAAPELPTLLRHELTHIEQHDNAWLLVITLVEKLLWWNPLVRYLGRATRHLQELSCDERCQACDADYPVHLAQLMLTNLAISHSSAQEPLLLSANIFNSTHPDIQRLKVLQRSYNMKLRHIVSAIATAVLAITTVSLVTAQQEPKGDEKGQNNVVFLRTSAELTAAAEKQAFQLARDQLSPESLLPPGAHFTAAYDMKTSIKDEFIRMNKHGDDSSVSFKFTNTALPMALGPLAEFGNLKEPVDADGLAKAQGGTAPVTMKTSVFKMTKVGDKEPTFELPTSAHLKLDADGARTRQVTVSGENLSLKDAIDTIAKAANCNIFKDGDNIVVDWCGVQ